MSLIVLAGGASVWGGLHANRGRLEDWQAAAAACGLHEVRTSGFWAGNLSLRARRGPIQVRIEDSRREGHAPQIVVVAPWPPGFAGIRIRSEQDRPSKAREIEIGDEPFDGAFYIVGPIRLVLALLDKETRHLMIAVKAECALEIIGGELRSEVLHPQIPDILRLLLDIAQSFSRPLDAAQRLAENACQDPDAGVRLRNLLLLAREFPGEAGTTEALRTACADASPKVRLRAAKEVGAEGRGVLTELAESTEDDAVSAQAVADLGRGLPLERTRAILGQALRRRLLRTARACLEALGDGGAAEDVDTLAKVLALEKGDLAAAAARALGATGSPAAEPHLLPALAHERLDVRVAAAKALGRTGTAAAVLPLKEASRRAGRGAGARPTEHTRDRELRSATRQAIAEIQSRLRGASPGQLSLAEAEGGKLSLAEAEAGRLSLANPADDAGGRLSLASAAEPPV